MNMAPFLIISSNNSSYRKDQREDCKKKNANSLSLFWTQVGIFRQLFSQHKYYKKFKVSAVLLLAIIIVECAIGFTRHELKDQITEEYLLQDLRPEQALWQGLRQEKINAANKQINTSRILFTQPYNKDKDDIWNKMILPRWKWLFLTVTSRWIGFLKTL